MTIELSNLTTEIKTWVATNELRTLWKGSGENKRIVGLEQKFFNVATGDTEWRKV